MITQKLIDYIEQNLEIIQIEGEHDRLRIRFKNEDDYYTEMKNWFFSMSDMRTPAEKKVNIKNYLGCWPSGYRSNEDEYIFGLFYDIKI